MSPSPDAPQPLKADRAQIQLQNFTIREDLVLDELHLEGGDVRYEPSHDAAQSRISTGETRVRAIMSEANLNRLAAANLPVDTPIRDLEIALLSGRARISGKAVVRKIAIPFSVEATPRVENGVRVELDCSSASLGIGLPHAVVEIVQQRINDLLRLDLSSIPIPIWLDELRCEPGRLTALGRARIVWPPEPVLIAAPSMPQRTLASGFVFSAQPLFPDPEPARPAITAGPSGVQPVDGAATVPEPR